MAKKKRAVRDAEKKRVEFLASQQRLARWRSLTGVAGFVPLVLVFACGSGSPVGFLCIVPPDWLLWIWAALFGTFLGLTIRLVIERRRFERGTTNGRAA